MIAALATCAPVSWSGSDPDCFGSLARELGLTGNADASGDLDEWEAVRVLAEVVSRLRLSPSDLERPMRFARVLPPLEGRPLAPPPGQESFRIGNDPVLDLLVNRAGRPALTAIEAAALDNMSAPVPATENHCPERRVCARRDVRRASSVALCCRRSRRPAQAWPPD